MAPVWPEKHQGMPETMVLRDRWDLQVNRWNQGTVAGLR